jgi:hypothetical protein
MVQYYDVVVAGAGASGLMAALRASERGCRVLLVEKKQKAGTKLAITGKGRCNITNTATPAVYYQHIYPKGRFLKNAFSRFFSNDMIHLLSNLGVETTVERGGRVFTTSGRAADITEALVKKLRELDVAFLYGTRVEKIITREGRVDKVVLRKGEQQEQVETRSFILCTGGKSYPATGSEGEGYELAASLGHSVTEPRPALVPLETREDIPEPLTRLVLKNVQASLWSDGNKKTDAFGEMFFTHYGLSGPIILSLSRQVVDEIRKNRPVAISIDLKPALDEKKLDNRLLRDIERESKKQMVNLFRNWLPSDLIPLFLERTGINPKKQGHQITSQERRKTRMLMKDMTFHIKGPRSFKEAIITAGGISTAGIHSRSMASKLIPNLFFAGEVIDLDADTGGYNLQIAYSTGWLAGDSAAGFIKDY